MLRKKNIYSKTRDLRRSFEITLDGRAECLTLDGNIYSSRYRIVIVIDAPIRRRARRFNKNERMQKMKRERQRTDAVTRYRGRVTTNVSMSIVERITMKRKGK